MPFLHRILQHKALLFANLILFVLLGWKLYGEVGRSKSLQADIDRLLVQAKALEVQNARLTSLGTEQATQERLEREARVKLGLQKPGESVIIVQDGRGPSLGVATTRQIAPQSPDQSLSNPQKWWRYFLGMSK